MFIEKEKERIITSILGNYEREGKEYLYFCPKCTHHKPKLSISFKKNAFKCWICKYSGRLVTFVKYYGNQDQYQDWLSLNNLVDFSEEQIENKQIKLPKEFCSLTNKPILNKKPWEYLLSRGLSKKDVFQLKMGYCDYGEYSGYIIIPSFDKFANLNFFIGRSFCGKRPYKAPSFPKSSIIFNELNVDWTDDIVLTEGVFDAVKTVNAIPLLGSSLKENDYLFDRLANSGQKIFIALDPDAQKKEIDIINLMIEYDIEVYKVPVTPFKDVGEMTKEEFAERKKAATLHAEKIWRLK